MTNVPQKVYPFQIVCKQYEQTIKTNILFTMQFLLFFAPSPNKLFIYYLFSNRCDVLFKSWRKKIDLMLLKRFHLIKFLIILAEKIIKWLYVILLGVNEITSKITWENRVRLGILNFKILLTEEVRLGWV